MYLKPRVGGGGGISVLEGMFSEMKWSVLRTNEAFQILVWCTKKLQCVETLLFCRLILILAPGMIVVFILELHLYTICFARG